MDILSNYVASGGNSLKGATQGAAGLGSTLKTKSSTLQTPASGLNGSDVSKYNIANYSYPKDIMSSQYGGNYAMFFINVNIDSKLAKPESGAEFVTDIPPRMRGDLLAKGGTVAGMVGTATAAGAVGGALAGGILSGDIKGAASGAIKGALGTAVVAGSLAKNSVTATRAQKRLKTAIALHVPNQLSVRYSTNWEAEDTFAYQAAEDIMKGLASGAGGQGGSGTGKIGKALVGAVKGGGGVAMDVIASAGMSKAPGGMALSAKTGLAANPKKEQVFKGVDYRTFSFDYQFFPRDADEAKNVINIIQEFKYHMHPEFKDSNNYLYIYPSEFDITYYSVDNKENKYLHRHTSCVLTELNINYTPNGQFTTFANGMPTQINITMNFRELGLLTKDMIKAGL
jgi:hypothetical protein